jgi:hypothetical protein
MTKRNPTLLKKHAIIAQYIVLCATKGWRLIRQATFAPNLAGLAVNTLTTVKEKLSHLARRQVGHANLVPPPLFPFNYGALSYIRAVPTTKKIPVCAIMGISQTLISTRSSAATE